MKVIRGSRLNQVEVAGDEDHVRPRPSKEVKTEKVSGLSPQSQGQSLALTVVHEPHSLDRGRTNCAFDCREHGQPGIIAFFFITLDRVLKGP